MCCVGDVCIPQRYYYRNNIKRIQDMKTEIIVILYMIDAK